MPHVVNEEQLSPAVGWKLAEDVKELQNKLKVGKVQWRASDNEEGKKELQAGDKVSETSANQSFITIQDTGSSFLLVLVSRPLTEPPSD